MKHGFVKVAAVTPQIKLADTSYNGEKIRRLMKETAEAGAKVVVFPELCITGAACEDLFYQKTLLGAAREELLRITEASKEYDAIFFVGLPCLIGNCVYNVVAGVSHGELCGMVPKILPSRQFTSGKDLEYLYHLTEGVPAWAESEQLFVTDDMPHLRIGVEVGEDAQAVIPPSATHVMHGATLIINPSADYALAHGAAKRQQAIEAQSARLHCGYIYVSAGEGESTQDGVYCGEHYIAENGHLLCRSTQGLPSKEDSISYTEIDVDLLMQERRKHNICCVENKYTESDFSIVKENLEVSAIETELTRHISKSPFVPEDEKARRERAEEVFSVQTLGLKKRMTHTFAKNAVIGISGGLDSTLALLVTARCFDMMGKDRSDIIAVTMPGFGTTDRTYENAVSMIKELGATFMEVDIKASVRQHFADIGHDESVKDITYENAQARERTQILMDIANRNNGMVIGTGDMSELALGWATYNGDHMSMYGVNAGVPKTLVRHLVRYYADSCGEKTLAAVLYDVLDTPVSPELLPPEENGEIAQKTEDLVGPYELHDFFIYYALRYGFAPDKIYRMAQEAFCGTYEKETILKWLKNFYRRFFMQQFKRSCLPDGPKVGSVGVSPRGDLCMPSDACANIWLAEVEKLS